MCNFYGNVEVRALGRAMPISWSSQSENGNRQVKLACGLRVACRWMRKKIATLQHFRFAAFKPEMLVQLREGVSDASVKGIFLRIQSSCNKTGKTLSRHSPGIIMEQMKGMNDFQPEGKYSCTIKTQWDILNCTQPGLIAVLILHKSHSYTA